MKDTPYDVQILAREGFRVAGSTSLSEILIGPVPAGWAWRIDSLGVENHDGTASRVEFSVYRNGIRIPFSALTTLVAAVKQFTLPRILIPETAYLSAYFTTIQANTDALHVWITGVQAPADKILVV